MYNEVNEILHTVYEYCKVLACVGRQCLSDNEKHIISNECYLFEYSEKHLFNAANCLSIKSKVFKKFDLLLTWRMNRSMLHYLIEVTVNMKSGKIAGFLCVFTSLPQMTGSACLGGRFHSCKKIITVISQTAFWNRKKTESVLPIFSQLKGSVHLMKLQTWYWGVVLSHLIKDI